MINKIIESFKTDYLYGAAVVLLLAFFTYDTNEGAKYFPDKNVQKNAGYSGPVPHSGYGVRFYHK